MNMELIVDEKAKVVYFIHCDGCGWEIYFRTAFLARAMVRVKHHHNNPHNRRSVCYDGQYLGSHKARKITDPREIARVGNKILEF